MATTIDHGNILSDPEQMLAQREGMALRCMTALISIAENGKDERSRVAAATELNKMLSLGLLNRHGLTSATQVNNLKLPSGKATDEATSALIRRLTPAETEAAVVEATAETLDALNDEEAIDDHDD
jgi:hypothetical protein